MTLSASDASTVEQTLMGAHLHARPPAHPLCHHPPPPTTHSPTASHIHPPCTQLTVKETLMMAAELRMSRDTSAEEKEAYVDGIISRLGLAKVC